MKRDNLKRLTAYLRDSEGWLSAEELATQLHTTTRTVRSYVQQLNSSGKQVIESSIRGYRWAAKRDEVSLSLRHRLPQTPAERGLYALRQFLWQDRIAVERLLEAMVVSDRTLDADLNHIRQMLRPFRMSLHRRKEILYLTGKEIDRRCLIVHCVRRSDALDYLTLQYVTNAFAYFDVPGIHALLGDVLIRHGLETNGYICYELLLYVVIQLEQIQRGNVIRTEEFAIPDLDMSPDYLAARELATALEAQFNVSYPQREVEYLAALFLAKADYCGAYGAPQPAVYSRIHEIVLQSLEQAGMRLKLDFFQANFPERLTHYFQRMTVRQQLRLSSPHPLTQSLRNVHPLLLETAAQMLLQFAEYYDMPCPNHESGSLALTLADYMYARYDFESKLSAILVCPAFGHLAEQIRDDLVNHLGNALTIKHLVTTMDIDKLPEHHLILSVLPLSGFPHAVIISPMPKSEDYRAIREAIQKIKERRRRWQLSAYLNSYLRPETFLLDAAFSDMEDLLHYICGQLVVDGAVDPGYEQEVLARERMDQTAFFDMLALPHTISDKVRRNSLYVVLNHVPLPWGETRVNLIVLIAMQPELRDDLYTLYGLLTHMFAKPKNINMILQAKNYCEFLETMPILDME